MFMRNIVMPLLSVLRWIKWVLFLVFLPRSYELDIKLGPLTSEEESALSILKLLLLNAKLRYLESTLIKMSLLLAFSLECELCTECSEVLRWQTLILGRLGLLAMLEQWLLNCDTALLIVKWLPNTEFEYSLLQFLGCEIGTNPLGFKFVSIRSFSYFHF